MTKPPTPRTTAAFYAQAAISFGVALFAVLLGIAYLPVSAWMRAFLALGALYLVTSTFTLGKVIRDQQEQGSVVNRLDEARLERLLAEFDPFHVSTAGLTPPSRSMAANLNHSQPAGPPMAAMSPASMAAMSPPPMAMPQPHLS